MCLKNDQKKKKWILSSQILNLKKYRKLIYITSSYKKNAYFMSVNYKDVHDDFINI